jgi:thiol:disulfide interchange protein DsbC
MTKYWINCSALAIAALTFNAHADEDSIKKALATAMPSAKIESIKPSEIKGIEEVIIEGNIFYVSEDGKYLFQGHLIDIKAKKDLTESKLAIAHKQDLDLMGENNMIIFKPKIKKYQVSVFTDIDCGYCRKLHSEIDQYMAEGITIRYLFFPRSGKGSESYNKAISVWCADDRHAALTAAKLGKTIEAKQCKNPVDAQMSLGEKFGARGTPMIVTEKGNILPGYVPAKQLAQTLATEANGGQN